MAKASTDVNLSEVDSKKEDLSYMAKPFVLFAIPQTRPITSDGKPITSYTRVDGKVRLDVFAKPGYEIPYSRDEVFLRWLKTRVTQLKRQKVVCRKIFYKDGASILKEMGLTKTGNNLKWLKEVILRCHNTAICYSEGNTLSGGISKNEFILSEVSGFFNADSTRDSENYFIIGELFAELTSIPVDDAFLSKLGKNYLAKGLYMLLNYRFYRDRAPGVIPFETKELRMHLNVPEEKEDKYFRREFRVAINLLSRLGFKIRVEYKNGKVIVHKRQHLRVLSKKLQEAFSHLDQARETLS